MRRFEQDGFEDSVFSDLVAKVKELERRIQKLEAED